MSLSPVRRRVSRTHRTPQALALLASAFAIALAAASPAQAQDTTAPTVSSFTWSVQPNAYAEKLTLPQVTAGSRFVLDVTASEALRDGTLTLSGPSTIVFERTNIVGNRAIWDVTLATTPAAGTYAASVRIVDPAGNASSSSLTLPAPGFVSTGNVDSPCLVSNPTSGDLCTDLDGDGRPGRSAVCDLGGDCDDSNPTIHVRAPEISGDGVNNETCSASGDGVLSDANGLFVSPWPITGVNPTTGTIDPQGLDLYDLTASCTLFHAIDGSMYFWDSEGVRGALQCNRFTGSNLPDPSRDVNNAGACWAPIFARSGGSNAFSVPITAMAPGQALSEVAFSATACSQNNNNACTISWRPRDAAISANLGTAGSGWYTNAANVKVNKPAWGTACPKAASASDFTWSPPGLGVEDVSCKECDGTKTAWTMNRAAAQASKFQYVDNPRAHPTIVIAHDDNWTSSTTIAAANRPDSIATVGSERWPMYTMIVFGNVVVSSNTQLVIGSGTRKNGYPSLMVGGGIAVNSGATAIFAGGEYCVGAFTGTGTTTTFGRRINRTFPLENGTRHRPFNTLRAALNAAAATGKQLYVSHGDFDDGNQAMVLGVPLVGAYVEPGWERVPLTQTNIRLTRAATINGPVVTGVAFDAQAATTLTITPTSTLGVTTLIDVNIAGNGNELVVVNGVGRFIRTDVSGAAVRVAGNLAGINGSVQDLIVPNGGIAVFARMVHTGATTVGTGIFKASRDVFFAPVTATDANLTIAHSTFLTGASTGLSTVRGSGQVTNTIFGGSGTGWSHVGGVVRPKGNLFAGTCAMEPNGSCAGGCPANNVCGPPGFIGPGDHHIAAGSLAVDNGIDHDPQLIPSMSVVDLDGQCVADPDIGADER